MVAVHFELNQNYPNPFNPTTRITYTIPASAFVTLTIYDILGKEVNTLVHEYQNTGSYSIPFDAHGLSSGVYFYKLDVSGHAVEIKKMVLMK